MRYAKIDNGAVAEYPLFEHELRRRFPNVSFPASFEPPEGYAAVAEEAVPAPRWDQRVEEVAPVRADGGWRRSYTLVDLDEGSKARSVRQAKLDRLAELAALRWQKETSGITFAEAPFATDATSQTKYLSAALAAQMDPALSLMWKAKDGRFVRLGAAEIAQLAAAVRAHVQACFDREAELRAAIEAADTPDAVKAVVINTGWPNERIST